MSLYTPWSNGTFETPFPDNVVLNYNAQQGLFSYSSEDFYAGTHSGLLKATDTGGYFSTLALGPMRTRPAQGYPGSSIPLQAGKKYRTKFRFKIPSAAPIATDDCWVFIGDPNEISYAIWTDLGGGLYSVFSPGSDIVGKGDITTLVAKVSALKDNWVELYYDFVEPASGNPNYAAPTINVQFRKIGTSGPAIPSGQTIINGKMFIDDGQLDLVIACDLAFNSTAFTKTDETASGASDGTITINASSSFTKSYSLDGVTYQVSNLFAGLAPGNYTIYVKDTNPNGCNINQAGITILPFSSPLCDLAFGTPAFVKVNESAPGANDGSVTINATSSYPISYSINSIAGFYQPSNLFNGLPDGDYVFFIKDTNPNGCQLQIAVHLGATSSILLIDEKPINSGNFVSWFNTTGDMDFASVDCFNENWDLAQGYRANKISSMRHSLIAYAGNPMTFYINLPDGLTDPDFSSYRLGLANGGGVVASDIAILKKDTFDDGVHYNIYCDNISLSNLLPLGRYYLIIYNQSTNQVKLISNEIELVSLDDAKTYSIEVKHRASFNMYGYRYEALTEFLNTVRLRMYKIDEQADGDLTQYRGASTGRLRNVSFELDRYIVLQTYFFDDNAHRAMHVFQAHDYILLNDIAYLPKSLYKVEFNLSRKLNKGTIEMYEQKFSQANRYSSAPITVVGSDDPLLLGDNGGYIKL